MATETSNFDTIFCAAIEIEDEADRAAYIARACGEDTELRHGVEKLVAAHFRAGSFMEPLDASHSPQVLEPLLGGRGGAPVAEPIREVPGVAIGPYKLLEQIGEGGFGVVFMAEQLQPLRRKVALKVLKPGMDTRQVVARFEAERQALALMDHPHIAHVFDGGETSSGRPYFVMELVRGVPITDFCDRNQLPVRERLQLFVSVCQAVQHAHQKGIIHRDLKPSNVLVTMHDDKAVPKVIDFGIAKATSQQLTEKTLFTNFAQMLGTPLYMSPEQAQMSGLDIDTRSDIYSLGVLLYELLTGTTPFDQERMRTVAYDEMQRIIREEEPPRPSTRISTLGPAAVTVSANRSSEPKQLSQLCRRELDWIVMKALEKDRNRRYESANAFAADVERYLHDESVEACPPSLRYWFRKFARRNKVLLCTIFAVSVAVVLAVAVLVVSVVVISRERTEAMRQRDDAQAQRQRARRAVDKMFTEVAEKWLAQQPRLEPLQKQFLEEALRFYEELAQEHSTDPKVRLETAKANHRVGLIRQKLGDHALAEEGLNRAIDLLDRLVADFPAEPGYRAALADNHVSLGWVLTRLGRVEETEQHLRRSMLLREQLVVDCPHVADHRQDLALSYAGVAHVHATFGRFHDAVAGYRQALAALEKLPPHLASTPECRFQQATYLQGLGSQLAATGLTQEGETSARQAMALLERLVAEHPQEPRYRHNCAWCHQNLGAHLPQAQAREAETLLRRALAMADGVRTDFPAVPDYQFGAATCRKNLGLLLLNTGRWRDAEETLDQAMHLYDELFTEMRSLPDLWY
jgi:serine/threonine protein kinase